MSRMETSSRVYDTPAVNDGYQQSCSVNDTKGYSNFEQGDRPSVPLVIGVMGATHSHSFQRFLVISMPER